MPTRDEINRVIADAVGWEWHQGDDGSIWVVNPLGGVLLDDFCDEIALPLTVRAADELVRLGKIEGWTLDAGTEVGANALVFVAGRDRAVLAEDDEGGTHAERLATALYRALGGEG